MDKKVMVEIGVDAETDNGAEFAVRATLRAVGLPEECFRIFRLSPPFQEDVMDRENCDKDHTEDMTDQELAELEKLPASQKNIARHVCACCAYRAGFEAGREEGKNAAIEATRRMMADLLARKGEFK